MPLTVAVYEEEAVPVVGLAISPSANVTLVEV